MGKEWIVLLFFIFMASALASDLFTGEVITGKVTEGSTGVSIMVIGRPSIFIGQPENKTYLIHTVLTNYTYFGLPDNVTYSIDGAPNVTLFGPTNIFYSEGQRFLELYASNIYGSGGAIEYFTINTTLLRINYTDYNGSTRGSSTDFYKIAYEDLFDLGGVILENTDYGKIEFSENINVEEDLNNTDGWVYINRNVKAEQDSMMVNSTALPNFNVSGTIFLYGVAITNPQILLDGAVCPINVCTEVFYAGGTYIFNTTYLGTFSLQETPAGYIPPSSGGGGGGGGGSETHFDLDLITPGIVEIGKEDHIVIPIIVRNGEDRTTFKNIKLEAETEALGIFPSFENILITELKPGENQTVMLFVDSINVSLENFEIEMIANVGSPKFDASETLFMKTVSMVGKVEVLERILLAQELFRENPECLELGDLLIQAQNLLDSGNVDDSRTLVQEAILKCRQLVANKEYPNLPNFGTFDAWRTPVEIALILIVITLIVFALLRRKRIDLRTAKGTKKKGFFKRMFGRRKKKKKQGTVRRSAVKTETLKPIEI